MRKQTSAICDGFASRIFLLKLFVIALSIFYAKEFLKLPPVIHDTRSEDDMTRNRIISVRNPIVVSTFVFFRASDICAINTSGG